jgi:radical SAM superfamily enzyme YgiQ (UPF0313 family)
MNILLIYPGLVEGFDSYGNGFDWLNHGIGSISSVLKKNGHTVYYLDCRRLKGWNDLTTHIYNINFDIALLSIATVDFDAAVKISKIIKSKDHNLKIMVGGPHPTLMTEQTLNIQEFDYVFTHEAEITLPQVLESYPHISRLIKGEMPANLDALPFVDRSLSPKGETPWFKGLMKPYFAITASRGCLYNCAFCQPAERALFGNKVRKRSIDNILDELDFLHKDYNMKSFMIHDDCFTQYASWVEEFCNKKMKRNLMQPFACQSRADIICNHPEIISKLKDAGLKWVLIGFESGSNRMLSYINKGTSVSQNICAANICHQIGINIFANYMFGLPTETNDEMKQTLDMINLIKPEMRSPAVFSPHPGSLLYNYCLNNDLLLIQSSEGYRRNIGSGKKIRNVDYDFVNRIALRSLKGWYFRPFLINIKSCFFSLKHLFS